MPEPTTLSPLIHDARHRHVTAVTVHVNERRVALPAHETTGLNIKEAAIAQGVPIELDFILVAELGNDRTKPITDTDRVHVTDHSRFLANDGDDNS
jgi:hypothetical protein